MNRNLREQNGAFRRTCDANTLAVRYKRLGQKMFELLALPEIFSDDEGRFCLHFRENLSLPPLFNDDNAQCGHRANQGGGGDTNGPCMKKIDKRIKPRCYAR